MWNEFKERFMQWFEKIKVLFLDGSQQKDPIRNQFENFEKNIIDKFIESLLNFFPEFPNEESSLEISEKISDWLVELAFLLSEL